MLQETLKQNYPVRGIEFLLERGVRDCIEGVQFVDVLKCQIVTSRAKVLNLVYPAKVLIPSDPGVAV